MSLVKEYLGQDYLTAVRKILHVAQALHMMSKISD
jgi:hypothetical protein